MTVMALKKNNMKKGPFKMKGYSYPGSSPAKNKDNELVQDSTKQQGYQITGSGIQTFKSVERLKAAGAPKDVINKEYEKQIKLFKEKAQRKTLYHKY